MKVTSDIMGCVIFVMDAEFFVIFVIFFFKQSTRAVLDLFISNIHCLVIQ